MAWSPTVSIPALSRLPVRPVLGPVRRNLTLDLTSAVGLGATMALVGVLLPSLARRDGLDSMGLAALAALPFLASLVTLFAGRIGPRTPRRMALLRAAGALGLLMVLIAPDPFFIALATLGFWVAFALGAPLQQRIWATVYPSEQRGRLLGYVGTGRSAAGTLALLAITVLAASYGWAPVVIGIALVGALFSLAIGRMEVPGIEVVHRFSATDSIRAVLEVPMLRRVTAAQLLFGAGFLAAPALIAMVHIDRLGLGLDQIALAGLLGYGTTAATYSLWGRLAGRVGAPVTITAGTAAGTLALVLFAFAPDMRVLVVATVLLGAAGASVDVSWPLLIADYAVLERQSAVSAGMNSIMAVRGLVTPFLVMAPISAGLADETGGLLVSATLMVAGMLVYSRVSGVWDVGVSGVRRLTGLLATLADRSARGLQRRPAMPAMPLSSISGWPVSLRSRLMRSTMAGWVLNSPRALWSSFLTGFTK
jgi:predicted MFS family arabinose efflux permease